MPTVKDIATKPIYAIDARKTVLEAANKMKEHGRGSLIVYEGNSPHGIITEKDLIRRVLAENLPYTTKVEEVMSKPLITVEANMDLRDAARLMLVKKIRRLPIEENGWLIGLINSNDILRNLSKRTLTERIWDFLTSYPI
jgi:signal-transduction protein with cAMP-binding, CBS, and nucleotidyltransferase domain